MGKKHILLLLSALLYYSVQAQQLVVYSLLGKVEVIENGQSKRVRLRDNLKADAVLNIPPRGCVVIFDGTNNRQYTLKKAGHSTVREMLHDKCNSIRELSRQYAIYIAKQIKSGKLTLVRNCSDPAAVTRDLCIYNTNLAAEDNDLSICGEESFSEYIKRIRGDFDDFVNGSTKDFDEFANNANEDLSNFRQEINREFVAFVRQPWENFESKDSEPIPKDNEIKPDTLTQDNGKYNTPIKPVELPVPTVVETMPHEEDSQADSVVPVNTNEKVQENFEFVTFGTRLKVRLSQEQHFRLISVSEDDVANVFERLTKDDYDNALYDCLTLREKHHFSDWAYYQMLKDLGEAFCGSDSNEAILLTAYMMLQSGYKLRIGRADGKLYVLPHTNHMLYGVNYFSLPDGNFFVLNGDIHQMDICNVAFHAEKPISLFIPQTQQYEICQDEGREIKSKKYEDICIKIHTNKNLIDFFNTYPASEMNKNMMTKWAMYANTIMDPYVENQFRNQLPAKLEGLSAYEKVSRLLDLCQTGLAYEFDDIVWGHDRAFFAEESLHYPFADCEDRCILFTRLVRDFIGLPCVLIYYPGHLAAGVCFGNEQIDGEYIELNGIRFVITDPTYIGAPIGISMPDLDKSASQAIILE